MSTNEERSRSTKKGIRAEALARKVVGGKKGACDVHTIHGGFELHWGPTSKNAAGIAADLKRSQEHGGRCVQISGVVPRWKRRLGVISLYEFLSHHDVENPVGSARAIREAAEEGSGSSGDVTEEMQMSFL